MVPSRSLLAGREAELGRILVRVEEAAGGHFAMVLLSGEPGVGKTSLLSEISAQMSSRTDRLIGACLPLTSLSLPFLPLRAALRTWRAQHDDPGPIFRPGENDHLPEALDDWLERRAAERPVLLLIDDLHWADQSTLDVLTYLLAGRPDRRLAVLVTVRSNEVTDGHRLHRWLADAARMPGFSEILLGPLDRAATADQVAKLLGGPARESLVDEVYAHTHGNPYLTRLLVDGLPPDSATLPESLPATIQEALLRTWHGLSPGARILTRLVAVGGHPATPEELLTVADSLGLALPVVDLLSETLQARVLEAHGPAAYWFHHPMQAEVLEAITPSHERQAWHRAHASRLESRAPPGVRTAAQLVAIADHHARAGDRDAAYRAALVAATAVGEISGPSEKLRLLRRAIGLREHVAAPESRHDLLQAARDAAEHSGDHEAELALVEDLLDEVSGDDDPVARSELLLRRMRLRLTTGRGFRELTDLAEAARITAHLSQTWQHISVLAELAGSELWHGVPGAVERVHDALRRARESKDPRALGPALVSASMVWTLQDKPGGGELAAEAVVAARAAEDLYTYTSATAWVVNSLLLDSPDRALDYYAERRREISASGAPHTYVAVLSAWEADLSLRLGDAERCGALLRVALGTSTAPLAEVSARLTAAGLAALQGRPQEARAHLHRAEEIFTEHSGYLTLTFDQTRAVVALAEGDPERALRATRKGLDTGAGDHDRLRALLPLAARAVADIVESQPHDVDLNSRLRSELVALEAQHAGLLATSAQGTARGAQETRAALALFRAECVRADSGDAGPRRSGDDGATLGAAWVVAVEECRSSTMPWDEAYACLRAAEAHLGHRSARRVGATLLRRGYALATALGAEPLLGELEALARSARLPLTPVGRAGSADDSHRQGTLGEGHGQPHLTPREREVLARVVAGRTYAEIALELFISEKTVSVHVSNLLHKTGTASRVELASMARRRASWSSIT